MAKAIVFDFWGTLVENGVSSPLFSSYKILRVRMPFGEFVVQFEDVFMTRSFNDQAEGFTAVCQAFNVRPLPIIIDKLVGTWNKSKLLAKPYDDTIKGLEALRAKGYKLALVSNAPMQNVEPVLEKFDLAKHFDTIMLSYSTGLLKTNPELFDKVAEQLGVDKDDMVMVGDSMESDIAGAEKAGVAPILMDRRNKRPEYERRATSMAELDKFI